MRMPSKLFDDDDGDSPVNEVADTLPIDEKYGSRLIHNRERDDLRRYEKAVAEGEIDDEDDDDESESEEEVPEPNDDEDDIAEFIDSLVKVRAKDPVFRVTGLTDGVDEEERKRKKEEKKKEKEEKKKNKKKKMYLKDVQARQLLEGGPDSLEENEERRGSQSYAEKNEELKRAVRDAVETGEGNDDDDDEDLFRVKEGDEQEEEEEDEELKKKADEYFGEVSQLGEKDKFLRDFIVKQMWKEKDGKSKIDEDELDELDKDEEALWMQEDYEYSFRHEENAGETVMGQSRIVEGSVRKKDNSRKTQRKNKEERLKMVELERQEELKRLKNVKKKEMREKMKKVLSVAGFKEGEECPLDARDLEDEFDPEEYDKMMKAAFDDNYYGAEDEDLCSDDDDNEKPDFDKEDELLGLPKNWDVIQGGDGFTVAREKVLKLKENVAGDEEEEEAEVEEVEEEREGKRKRKRKTSLVQRAKEALMEEYYKLDYEDTIGDLKTRFRFAKVQPNNYGLEPEEILFLDDTELNQYVPLKKMAPFMEKDWEVNSYKVKDQKRKVSELWEKMDDNHDDEKKRSKKIKKNDVEEKKTKKPVEKAADEEGEAETSKLSRRAKRRRREAEKKLPPNRMAAYGKAN
ncbi:protein KRI1 homolog [Eutrema salsugineum]|uniref:protein KRI1 homolog n=1 Tax=Eutrema salsugineum TaxID=72664 RepID=UPI000CED373A|nr:protein KRI1 homolog [Eutrema salsugineum]